MISGDKKAIVIGAGVGGLATAALLGKMGWEVTVLEKNDRPGGRARTWESGGFVYDMGPSWYLMPAAFERYFSLFDKAPEDLFRLIRLDPQFRVFSGSGGTYDVRDGPEPNAGLFDKLEPDGAAKVGRYLARAREQYELAVRHFLYREYDRVTDFLRRDILSKAPKLGVLRSVHGLAGKEIGDERLQQILEFAMVFIGGAPRRTPGLYALMSSIVLDLGVWYPMGGIAMVVQALLELGRKHGVRYEFGRGAEKIRVSGGLAREVLTADGPFPADVVVSNADYHHTETVLLEPPWRSYGGRYWASRVLSPSAFILFLGVDGKVDGLLHHNLYFERNWEDHFGQVFGCPAWPERFSYYVCCPSKSDPSVAPEGRENLFILVPVAPGLDDGEEIREEFAERVLAHLETLLGRRIRDRLSVRRVFSQRDFISDYNTLGGTAFSLSHTLFQTAAFRPSRRSRRVANLYFSGQYTHPGVGLPMVLIAAELAARRIADEQR